MGTEQDQAQDLRAQAEAVRRQSRALAVAPEIRRKPPSFRFWYTNGLIVVVAALSYLLVPAVRERIHDRLGLLIAAPQRHMETTASTSLNAPTPGDTQTATPTVASDRSSEQAKPLPSPVLERHPVEHQPSRLPLQSVADSAVSTPLTSRPAPPAPRAGDERIAAQPTRRRSAPVLKRGLQAGDQDTQPENPKAVQTMAPKSTDVSSGVTTPHAEEAYKILLDKIPKMASLANKTDPDLQIKSWTVLRAEESEVWIDLVAVRKTDAQEEHFIWKIYVTDMTVRPLNQSARRVVAQ